MSHTIERVKTNKLKIRKENPNVMKAKEFDFLVKEIKNKGMVQPILVDSNYTIIDGEHRFKAAMRIGLQEVDVVVVDIDETDALISLINMNKIKGQFDEEKYALLIGELVDAKGIKELEDSIFAEKYELEALLKSGEEEASESTYRKHRTVSEVVKPEEDWFKFPCEIGDVWKCGNSLLYCMDYFDKIQKTNDYTLVVIHPDPDTPIQNAMRIISDIESETLLIFCNKMEIDIWLSCCKQLLSDNYAIDVGFWKSDYPHYTNISPYSINVNIMPIICAKSKVSLEVSNNAPLISDLFHREIQDQFFVSNIFPNPLPKDILQVFFTEFTEPTDLILDIGSGSGTSLISGVMAKRTVHCIEKDPKWCNLSLTRWANVMDEKPVKL